MEDSRTLRFEIKFTEQSIEDLQIFRKSEQAELLAALESELGIDAATETADRKRLYPDASAEWELRIGQARVFYDVDVPNRAVKILAVGKKISG